MSTARTIRRFTDEPVDDGTLARCLEAARWAPSDANAHGWRFVVLRSPEQRAVVAKAAAHALEVIEPVYGMSRPAPDENSRRARTYRATYQLHDRAGEFTSVLFAQKHFPTAAELLLGGSIFPAMQNFLLAARAQGLGARLTSWASYGGEQLLRKAVGVPEGWLVAGHIVIGWRRRWRLPMMRCQGRSSDGYTPVKNSNTAAAQADRSPDSYKAAHLPLIRQERPLFSTTRLMTLSLALRSTAGAG